MDRNVDEKGQYKFNWRARHTTAVVGEVLYCWGGDQKGLDGSHDSPTKRECTSAIDAFNLLSGVWSSQPTRGTPPLGIRGVSCTTINNNIYYFGGFCGHGSCYHNSLNCLDTLTLQWKELQSTTSDNSVTKRGYGGMIAMGSEGEPQQLLVIGGLAPVSTTTEYRQFAYHKMHSRFDRLSTNEQNIYNLSSGQWIVPTVSGQCFPPTNGFIIERISHNKGIMYGGAVTNDGISIPTSSIYLFEFSHNTINWECLNEGSIPNDGLWSKERYTHASTIINSDSTSPTLLVIGGTDSDDEPLNECLLLDTNQYNWMKFPLPDSVTGRYYHTVSSFVVDLNHVFLIIVGGYAKREQVDGGGGVMKWINKPVTYSHIAMVVELVFNDGQWSVESVNSHNSGMSRMNNQLLWEKKLKIKSEKSTQLLETKTLLTKRKRDQEDSPHSDYSKKHKTDELEESMEEKQIMTELEDTPVAENDVYMTEIEEVQFIKETCSVEVQFNYLIPSMDNLECLSDVQVAEKKLFLIQGDKPQLMNWEEFGLRIGVQEGSLLSSETVEAAVVALVGGQFQFPPNTVLVSAVYAVSLSEPLLKRLKLEIQHCIDLTGRPDLAQYLKFAIAPMSTPSLPYQFKLVKGGEFSSNSGYGSIQRNKFCLVCILGEESTDGNTEEGEEEEQPLQEENEEEEGDKEEGEGSVSDDDDTSSTPPGASGACKVNGDTEEGEENEEEDEFEEIQHESSDSSSVTKTNSIPNGAAKDPINEQKEFKDNEDKGQSSSTESSPRCKDNSQSTGLKKAIRYAGLVYYEEDGVEDLVTFTAVKKLNTLLEFIEKKHPQAKQRPHFYFHIASPGDGYIELILNAQQDEPFTGWSIKPHITPCRLFQKDIYSFGDKDYPLPPSCLISVYSSPDAVPTLHYSVPVEGVTDPLTLHIQISRRTAHPIAAAPSASGSNEAKPVSTKRGREGGFDIKGAKQKIKQVMNENHSDFADILESSLNEIANKLFEANIVTRQVQKSPTYDAIASSFLAIMNLLDSKSDLEKHCVKYLEALSSVGGPIEFAANLLRNKWTTALEGALEFEQSVKRVRTNDE